MAIPFVVGLALAVAALALLAARSRSRAPAPPAPGTLALCPASPNCVTSLAAAARHAVEPMRFQGEPEIAWERLRALLSSWPGAHPASERPGYLRVEFRSRFLGFVDDAEFLLDAPNRRIDVRSASRVGWSDLGANRRRIAALTRRFTHHH